MAPIYRQQQTPAPADLAAIAAAVRWRAAQERALGGSLTGALVGRRAYNALDWGVPAVDVVRGQLLALLQEHVGPGPWQLSAWGNVNRAGDGNAPHHHGAHPGHWVAVYYVDPGDGARTTFYPGPDAAEPELYIEPVPGLLVLFPASTWHGVETSASSGAHERITLAFNAWPAR